MAVCMRIIVIIDIKFFSIFMIIPFYYWTLHDLGKKTGMFLKMLTSFFFACSKPVLRVVNNHQDTEVWSRFTFFVDTLVRYNSIFQGAIRYSKRPNTLLWKKSTVQFYNKSGKPLAAIINLRTRPPKYKDIFKFGFQIYGYGSFFPLNFHLNPPLRNSPFFLLLFTVKTSITPVVRE